MNLAVIERVVAAALAEDIGDSDITTEAVVPAAAWASAIVVAKEGGILAGLPIAEAVFRGVDPALDFRSLVSEGASVERGVHVLQVEGSARSILTAERTALNFLQRLSGIATAASVYVAACTGTQARIVDTRKTAPGLRALDKYAVRMGGASNHRAGLYDGVLIKENHIRAGGGISLTIAAARQRAPHTAKIEVECDSLAAVQEALGAEADIILLDNMSTEMMTEAVKIIGGMALVEASGNMTLERIPEVARTGVDLISVGALTHSVIALDLSLQITSWRNPEETTV